MAQAGGEGVGEGVGAVDHGGQANGAAAPQPVIRNAPAAPPRVGNAAPPAAAAAPVIGPAAVPLAARAAAAAAAAPVIGPAAVPNLRAPAVNAQPRFDVEGPLKGPVFRKSTTRLCKILPRVDEEEEL